MIHEINEPCVQDIFSLYLLFRSWLPVWICRQILNKSINIHRYFYPWYVFSLNKSKRTIIPQLKNVMWIAIHHNTVTTKQNWKSLGTRCATQNSNDVIWKSCLHRQNPTPVEYTTGQNNSKSTLTQLNKLCILWR